MKEKRGVKLDTELTPRILGSWRSSSKLNIRERSAEISHRTRWNS
jgi:hypothetical protein